MPKNAGTSFKSLFTKCLHTEGISQEQQKQNKKKFGVQGIYQAGFDTEHNKWAYWQNVFVDFTPVAFLRNPWARALSTYLYSLQHSKKNIAEEWGWLDHARLTQEGFKRSWMEGGFFVDDHAKQFEQNKTTLRNWRFKDTQASWLDGAGVWFRMEDQQNDFAAYTGTPEMQTMNATTKAKYQLYFDEELKKEIARRFAEDVDLGKYTF